VKIEHSRY